MVSDSSLDDSSLDVMTIKKYNSVAFTVGSLPCAANCLPIRQIKRAENVS